MCVYCERNQNVKFGWNQPCFYDENWTHPSDTIPDRLSTNLSFNGNDWEARVYDFQTSTPELILTSKNVAQALYGGGEANIHIPIHFCPVCGRKLGKKQLEQLPDKLKEYISELEEEINRCHKLAEQNMDDEATTVAEMMVVRVQVLTEVKNDLESRLEELI